MYLRELKMEQKELFLDLCINISRCDADFAQEEKELIKKICEEMNIEEKYTAEGSMEDILEQLAKKTTPREKRIITIELVGVIMVDNKLTEEESEILKRLSDIFAIGFDEIEALIQSVKKLYTVYSEFADFQNGKLI